MGTFVVVVGGGRLAPSIEMSPEAIEMSPSATVIAVDSGLDVALASGLVPTLLVGDLDSISGEGLAWAEERGLRTERHPPDKDATDTALALAAAAGLARGDAAADLVLLCGSATDRLDHLLGILAALGSPDLGPFRSVSGQVGTARFHVVHGDREIELDLARGGLFSLLALHGPCSGVDVCGARWPLRAASMTASSTVGISNESSGGRVRIRCREGVLTVVLPATLAGRTS